MFRAAAAAAACTYDQHVGNYWARTMEGAETKREGANRGVDEGSQSATCADQQVYCSALYVTEYVM